MEHIWNHIALCRETFSVCLVGFFYRRYQWGVRVVVYKSFLEWRWFCFAHC